MKLRLRRAISNGNWSGDLGALLPFWGKVPMVLCLADVANAFSVPAMLGSVGDLR